MPDTGAHVERLVREIPDSVIFSPKPGATAAWCLARGIYPSLAAVIAERARRTETTRRKGGPTKKGTK